MGSTRTGESPEVLVLNSGRYWHRTSGRCRVKRWFELTSERYTSCIAGCNKHLLLRGITGYHTNSGSKCPGTVPAAAISSGSVGALLFSRDRRDESLPRDSPPLLIG